MVLIVELLCGLKKRGVMEITQVTGRGFEIDQIEPQENYPTFLIFTMGSGIRFLIASRFNADRGSDVKLFYGARNLDRMAYQWRAAKRIKKSSTCWRDGFSLGNSPSCNRFVGWQNCWHS